MFRVHGSEEPADEGGLLATQGHGDVGAQVGAKGHVWICSPDAAVVVCVDLRDSCYH